MDDSIKTLGLCWNPSTDCFQYHVNTPDHDDRLTKRVVLAEIARLFDPLGLLAPTITRAKIFMQSLWAEGLDWDQPLTVFLANSWNHYRNDLLAINKITIPRWLTYRPAYQHQLHGFCDASEAAYGAVIYMRCVQTNGAISVRIITAKTKVAPVKKISIPRLELCGALLLAKLFTHAKTALRLDNVECFAWCDSTVALAWIRKPAHHWQTFVANRVTMITELTTVLIWHYVPGTENPADAASRGLSASDLVTSELWWRGPAWLAHSPDHWPQSNDDITTNMEQKQNIVVALHAAVESSNDILHKFSSFNRLVRVTAFIRRFFHNLRHPKSDRRFGSLNTMELVEAERTWTHITQLAAFPVLLSSLHRGKNVAANGQLKSLNIFLDDDGLLRVGGRLENATISYDARHPILLPKISHMTQLLIAHYHSKNMHSGTQLTIATLRQKYWILAVRTAVKYHIHRCPSCIRHRHTLGRQLMAPLPDRRTQPTRAFLCSGVDYAGPLTIKLQPGRGTKTTKAYIALFVCFATKAIHLELVSSLSTEAFLAAFRRFVARRGKCAHLHSDCGTNFVGACKELRTLHDEVQQQFDNSLLADTLASDGTQWHFNPPGAPSFGGIWEAGVKSVKHHLRRVLGQSLLTFEEIATILTQIEAILNSRPITPMSDDANDLQALTPGHFLIGEPMTTVPDPTIKEPVPLNRRWQHLQLLTQHFWQRWRQEYMHTLQQRTKWTNTTDNLEPGMLALIREETLPPAKWALGRINEVHPGDDGLVRVATLKVGTGLIKRPINKLCIFPK